MAAIGILIAEIDSAVANDLTACLESFGYNVLGVATSGEDTLAKMEKLDPDLVLMNIRLKGSIDGIQTGSLIRKYHNTPIVYMVDSDSRTTIRRAGTTAPFGYIFKPLSEKQIFATIETAIIRQKLESQLHQSRQWLNTTLASIGDGVIATDEHGLVRFINPSAMEQTGWKSPEAIGKPLSEVFPFVDEYSQKHIDLLGLQNEQLPATYNTGFAGILLPEEKTPVQVEASITSIQDGRSRTYGSVLVFRDVTRQRQILDEIQRQANRAEALVEVASRLNSQLELDAVLGTICEITNRAIKASGTAVFLQDAQKDIFRNMAAASDDPALNAYQGDLFDIPVSVFETMLSRDRPVVVINEVQDYAELPFFAAYRKMDIRTLVVSALFGGSRLVGVLISAFSRQPKTLFEDEAVLLRGIADQASSAIENAELFEQVCAGRERQHKLTRSLVDIQETERRRIARELHDHLGQSLTGLQFMLQTARNQAVGEQRTGLEQIQEAVTEIIRDVREMSLNLRPSMLDDMGLLPTLHWHIDRYTSQTGIHVNFQYDEFPMRFPLEIETAAYRIVQEALTNTARHAQVKEVFVGLIMLEETLWVEVLDNGKGFNTSAEPDRPSSGLSGMRERAGLLGGYLLVESFINQGTQIVAALPLTSQPLERRKHDRYRAAGR